MHLCTILTKNHNDSNAHAEKYNTLQAGQPDPCPAERAKEHLDAHNLSKHLYPHSAQLTMQRSAAQRRTTQHSTAQHSTAQHSTAQHSTAHSMIQLDMDDRLLLHMTAGPIPVPRRTGQSGKGTQGVAGQQSGRLHRFQLPHGV